MRTGKTADGEAPEVRYRRLSLWLDGVPGPLDPRPALPGDLTCDVAIVGAGFTGLWTALSLAALDPGLRVVVLEREIAGFGPAGRNAGFVSAGIAGEARVYARRHGPDAVARAERAVIGAIDEIGEVVAREGIDCGYRKGGSIRVATSAPQLARIRRTVEARRASGVGAEELRLLDADALRARIGMAGVHGGSFTPHCARVDPARLARGLAEACERRGVVIHEGTAVVRVEPRRAVCPQGVVRAETVVLATEAFTTGLPRERRRYLPLHSQMIATEPLPAAVWRELGWEERETVADQHFHFVYAQRTPDDRIALGGHGALARFGSRIEEVDRLGAGVRARLERDLRRLFPAAAEAAVTHHWGGAFAAPRDWSMAIRHDPATGLAVAGGFTGHGLTASHLAGRTLADLILRRESELTRLPWVGHRSPRWEPEPLRSLGARAITGVLASADRHEDRTGRPARRVRLVERWLPGR